MVRKNARSFIEFISKVVSDAAKVRSLSERTFDYDVLDSILTQVVRILKTNIQPFHEELYDRCIADLNGLGLPERSVKAGATGADSDELAERLRLSVAAMRETVPEKAPSTNGYAEGTSNGHA